MGVTSPTDEKAEKEITTEKLDKAYYKLQVTVVEAADLVNKDKIGKSDPYVVVKFQDQEFRSPTVKNSLSPKWNFISSFKVSSEETDDIMFDVYDDDFGKDELQGSFSISIADAFDEAPNTKWFDLKGCKTGKIAISFEFNDEVESNIDDDKKAETMVEGGKTHKTEAKSQGQPDNSVLERKEKMAKRKQEKLRKEKEEKERQEKEKKDEKEKRDREKEENEKFEREKRERLEKLEKKKKAEKEKRDKERQEKNEKDALAKKEKEEKEAAAKKEKEEKEATAKKEREEKRKKEREEREEKQKQAASKKEKEIPTDELTEEDKPKRKVIASVTKSKSKEVSSKPNDTITRLLFPGSTPQN